MGTNGYTFGPWRDPVRAESNAAGIRFSSGGSGDVVDIYLNGVKTTGVLMFESGSTAQNEGRNRTRAWDRNDRCYRYYLGTNAFPVARYPDGFNTRSGQGVDLLLCVGVYISTEADFDNDSSAVGNIVDDFIESGEDSYSAPPPVKPDPPDPPVKPSTGLSTTSTSRRRSVMNALINIERDAMFIPAADATQPANQTTDGDFNSVDWTMTSDGMIYDKVGSFWFLRQPDPRRWQDQMPGCIRGPAGRYRRSPAL